ncbi:hypothetical protein GY45DRAFT_959536 [Cubamyces sp. BRFM 1775]|nr:hypothetical protein GY45DRAFT_959536 [Cubamyces sp. BRFM 1775]
MTTSSSAPFNRHDADVIIRSADAVDFRVHSQILAVASPIFEDMVIVARPEAFEDTPPGRHIPFVTLVEDGHTLDALLRLCYPIEIADAPWALEDIPAILDAALKYIMAGPTAVLVKEPLTFAKARPLQVWSIGCRFGLEKVARAGAEAALHFRQLGTYNFAREFVPAEAFLETVRGVSAGHYSRLLEFHRRAGAVPPAFTLTRPSTQRSDAASLSESSVTAVADDFYASLPYPDIICRAADGVELPLHKALLSMASPIFGRRVQAHRLEEAEQSRATSNDTILPVITCTEDGIILSTLLRFCYPGDHALPHDPLSLLAILDAAERYQMERIVGVIKMHWNTVIIQNPLSAYFAAVMSGLDEDARRAARHTLRLELSSSYAPEMEFCQPHAYHRLLNYHERARNSAIVVDFTFPWASDAVSVTSKSQTTSPDSHDHARHNRRNARREGAATQTTRRPSDPSCARAVNRTWIEERRATFRQMLVRQPGTEFHSDGSLFRSSTGLTLGVKPWCTCCQSIAEDIVRLGKSLPERVASELDKVRNVDSNPFASWVHLDDW